MPRGQNQEYHSPMSCIALISDIHANIEALEAVLANLESVEVDEIFCLGDIVGHGAAPSECLELVRSRCSVSVMGNHDLMASECGVIIALESVSAPIRFAREKLSMDQVQWLKDRPLVAEKQGFSLVHSSLHEPENFHYILWKHDARLHFRHQETPFSFIGHSHSPLIATQKPDGIVFDVPRADTVTLDPTIRSIINVGSVGQPRDNDARACYGLLDTRNFAFSWRRVPYDIKMAQLRIKEAGLPWDNAARLAYGR
jgi:diadenosine tetraphosphatase ApaH/serine/threonine PP2A family protein phosphatase